MQKNVDSECRNFFFFRNVEFERKNKVQKLQGVAHCRENFYLKRQKVNYLMIYIILSSNLHVFIISNYVFACSPVCGYMYKIFLVLNIFTFLYKGHFYL